MTTRAHYYILLFRPLGLYYGHGRGPCKRRPGEFVNKLNCVYDTPRRRRVSSASVAVACRHDPRRRRRRRINRTEATRTNTLQTRPKASWAAAATVAAAANTWLSRHIIIIIIIIIYYTSLLLLHSHVKPRRNSIIAFCITAV